MKFKDGFESAYDRLTEEQLYDIVADELSKRELRQGLWLKALEKSEGDENRAKALYVKYRVQSMKDECQFREKAQAEKRAQQQATAKREAELEEERRKNLPRTPSQQFWAHAAFVAIPILLFAVFIVIW